MSDWIRQAERFEYGEPHSASCSMEAYFMGDGRLHILIDNPWAGSTETGFGATTSINLKPEDARRFIEWAARQLETQEKT